MLFHRAAVGAKKSLTEIPNCHVWVRRITPNMVSPMIITCPQCATRYETADDAVTGEGRKVKCTGCGNIWLQRPQGEPAATEPTVPEETEETEEAFEDTPSGVLEGYLANWEEAAEIPESTDEDIVDIESEAQRLASASRRASAEYAERRAEREVRESVKPSRGASRAARKARVGSSWKLRPWKTRRTPSRRSGTPRPTSMTAALPRRATRVSGMANAFTLKSLRSRSCSSVPASTVGSAPGVS